MHRGRVASQKKYLKSIRCLKIEKYSKIDPSQQEEGSTMPLTMKEKNSVSNVLREEFRKASKKHKSQMLDEFCKLTGYNRSYGARKLRSHKESRFKHKSPKIHQRPQGRKRKYGQECLEPLAMVWSVMDFACGKRVAAGMTDVLDALLRSEEICLDETTEGKLRTISASTIDRLLYAQRRQMCPKGRATTKPGSLLKSHIPIRTGSEWNEKRPGYVEMDTVAHCGESTRGQYVVTLDVTDVETCWTEQRAALNKAAKHVYAEFKKIRTQFPFTLYGIDCDSGAEFINGLMYRYCIDEGITFTRGRPYKKNDGCHVEQKNWSIVRQTIGYGRFETERECTLLNMIYDSLRLLTNFFMPSQKLIAKERDGGRIIRTLEKPMTPYRRVIESKHIDDKTKAALSKVFRTLNPAALRREIVRLVGELYKWGAQLRGPQWDQEDRVPEQLDDAI